jgi:tetratricopeptide (TPR) repeat protein
VFPKRFGPVVASFLMRRLLLGSLVLTPALFVSAPALAQTPAPAPAPAAAPAAPAAAAPAAAGKGPSPYSELVQKGDRAYLARDFEGAIAAYRQEIEKNPNAPLGHYRLGEAQLAKGDTNEAELSWQQALRFAGKDERMRSKVLFVLSDLKERLKANDDAVGRWKQYQEHAQGHPEAKGYPATATDRIKRADEWKKIVADSAEVKARIEKRIKEADESMRKSSK